MRLRLIFFPDCICCPVLPSKACYTSRSKGTGISLLVFNPLVENVARLTSYAGLLLKYVH